MYVNILALLKLIMHIGGQINSSHLYILKLKKKHELMMSFLRVNLTNQGGVSIQINSMLYDIAVSQNLKA